MLSRSKNAGCGWILVDQRLLAEVGFPAGHPAPRVGVRLLQRIVVVDRNRRCVAARQRLNMADVRRRALPAGLLIALSGPITSSP